MGRVVAAKLAAVVRKASPPSLFQAQVNRDGLLTRATHQRYSPQNAKRRQTMNGDRRSP